MNVGIDSNVVIYAGLAPSVTAQTKELRELAFRAALLLHQHEKDTIFLPAIAVSEILIPVPALQRGVLVAALSEKFNTPPFDLHAAAIAADLWVRHKGLPAADQYANRQLLRSDSMIVASAKAAGVTCFYSHDQSCRALASLVMTARDLPKPTGDTPEGLFIWAALQRGEAPDI